MSCRGWDATAKRSASRMSFSRMLCSTTKQEEQQQHQQQAEEEEQQVLLVVVEAKKGGREDTDTGDSLFYMLYVRTYVYHIGSS